MVRGAGVGAGVLVLLFLRSLLGNNSGRCVPFHGVRSNWRTCPKTIPRIVRQSIKIVSKYFHWIFYYCLNAKALVGSAHGAWLSVRRPNFWQRSKHKHPFKLMPPCEILYVFSGMDSVGIYFIRKLCLWWMRTMMCWWRVLWWILRRDFCMT